MKRMLPCVIGENMEINNQNLYMLSIKKNQKRCHGLWEFLFRTSKNSGQPENKTFWSFQTLM
jgi:hypothetical protein